MREKTRKEKDEPMVTIPKTDCELPNLDIPNTDILDPMRQVLRRDIDDANVT